MKRLKRSPKRVNNLTAENLIILDTFRALESEIKTELNRLKEVKWDVRKLVEPYINDIYQAKDEYLRALTRSICSKDNASRAVAEIAANSYFKRQKNRPFLLDLWFFAHAVRRQLGPNCASDIAKAMNKFKVYKHADGDVEPNQASSLLDMMGVLDEDRRPASADKKDQKLKGQKNGQLPKMKVEFTEKEAIVFRFYMACRHIVQATPSDARYRDDLNSGKREGGNFVEKLSSFAKRQSTQKLLRLMETIHRFDGGNELSEDELTLTAIHGLEIMTKLTESLAERKAQLKRNKQTFNFEQELAVFKRKLGQKLLDNDPLSPGPITYFLV